MATKIAKEDAAREPSDDYTSGYNDAIEAAAEKVHQLQATILSFREKLLTHSPMREMTIIRAEACADAMSAIRSLHRPDSGQESSLLPQLEAFFRGRVRTCEIAALEGTEPGLTYWQAREHEARIALAITLAGGKFAEPINECSPRRSSNAQTGREVMPNENLNKRPTS